ncbi:MAG: right-handed parallel beta-helix repeat-containing protein [Bacteroides sp.]|nr:right-handed parallel beta-helix repeat-containing protein [Roseburia sp.]MCM1345842.1 right-handed parallel beta-helix repeat-containing protein [Bacteroides sp.]MCM1420232.1 right-handed parallel beta-helix repeat-containing protein [Bacteroides sp.]
MPDYIYKIKTMMKKVHYMLWLLCIVGLATVSCSDEEDFTSDMSARLSFSADTVRFDTVFTTIGSSTQRFKVYNRNDKGIRLNSVGLAQQGKSGFRINVDGQYGTSVSGVEVLHDDSMFVFVEVTAAPQASDAPVLIRDTVVFTLESGLRQHVILEAYGQDVVIMRAEVVQGDTELSAARPYLIYDSLVVAPEARLTIPAGAVLCFHNGASMRIHGQVECRGAEGKPVVFRGDRTDKLFPYLPYDRLDALWGGIAVFSESYGNVFDYVDIHGGAYGIFCEGATTERRKLDLTNSVIHNVSGNGLYVECGDLFVANTQISNSGTHCVSLFGGKTEFVHCTIAQFYPWNAFYGAALYFCNVQDDMLYPLEKAHFFNTIITGNSADDVSGRDANQGSDASSSDAVPFDFLFENCVLNTEVDEKYASCYVDCVLENEENETFKASNFRTVDTYNYIYDFRLSEQSVARGAGNAAFSSGYPFDMLGVPRPDERPDAGCYQWE